MSVISIGIKYDDANPSTYEGIQYDFKDGSGERVINTGRPTIDYWTAMVHIDSIFGENCTIMGSSSLNHFVMDGGELKPEEDLSEEEINQIKESFEKLK